MIRTFSTLVCSLCVSSVCTSVTTCNVLPIRNQAELESVSALIARNLHTIPMLCAIGTYLNPYNEPKYSLHHDFHWAFRAIQNWHPTWISHPGLDAASIFSPTFCPPKWVLPLSPDRNPIPIYPALWSLPIWNRTFDCTVEFQEEKMGTLILMYISMYGNDTHHFLPLFNTFFTFGFMFCCFFCFLFEISRSYHLTNIFSTVRFLPRILIAAVRHFFDSLATFVLLFATTTTTTTNQNMKI